MNKSSLTTPNDKQLFRDAVINFVNEKIITNRFPSIYETATNGKHSDCHVIINVSDEFYLVNSEKLLQQGKLNYYFPMGESVDSMGLNSIFGALQVLHSIFTFNDDWKVLIHCQAGANRSPTIKQAFYYMMLSEHLFINNGQNDEKNNRLLINIQKGHLPELPKMELFLKKCREAFDHPEKFLGGMFDWVMYESGISKIY